MLKSVAQFFTYLFHPLFVPLYGYSLLLFSNNYYSLLFPLQIKLLLICIVFSFTCILPVINLFILFKLRLIPSLKLDEGPHRTIPYLITSLFYFGMAYMIWSFNLPSVFKSLILAGAVSILLTTVINLKWKISAHMVGIGGLTGAALAVSLVLKQNFICWVYTFTGIAGLLGFSRLYLKAHSPAQVYAGYALGTASTFLFILGVYIVNLNIDF